MSLTVSLQTPAHFASDLSWTVGHAPQLRIHHHEPYNDGMATVTQARSTV